MRILKIYISQGRVATQLRCGGLVGSLMVALLQMSKFIIRCLSTELQQTSWDECEKIVKKNIIWHKNVGFGTEYINEVT